jgi:virulence factor Mce-like protein
MVRAQLVIFAVVGMLGLLSVAFTYMQVQSLLGLDRLTVTLQLPATGGLYRFSNVTYRGVQVGRVTKVQLAKRGSQVAVEATMSLSNTVQIPADLEAHVRSVSAVGEQYVDLRPRTENGPFLHDGSVIAVKDAGIPRAIGPVLDNVSTLLATMPEGSLHTLVDEGYNSVKGGQYDLQSLIDSTGAFSSGLDTSGEQTRALFNDAAPLVDSQMQSIDTLHIWSRSLAGLTDQLRDNDPQIRALLQTGPGFAQEATRLFNQLKPTIPILLANLSTLGEITATYNASLEQVLVLYPPYVAGLITGSAAHNPEGMVLGNYAQEFNDPPTCNVGYLPPSAWRAPSDTTTVDTPDGLYCKLPQDSPIAVRGLRNYPCIRKPGKRAPTAAICNSDQNYEPLAQRNPPIGPFPRDPNLEAQGVPPDSRWFPDQGLYSPPGQGPGVPPTQLPVPPPPGLPVSPLPRDIYDSDGLAPPPVPTAPEEGSGSTAPTDLPEPSAPGGDVQAGAADFSAAAAPAAAVAAATYNPRTGEYIGPDGRLYRQADLVPLAANKTWKDLVLSE